MAYLHAFSVHFPVVLITLTTILFWLQLVQNGKWPHAMWYVERLLLVSLLSHLLALATGTLQESNLEIEAAFRDELNLHETLAYASFWLNVGAIIWLKWRSKQGGFQKMEQFAFGGLLAFCLLLLYLTAHQGGLLVYEFGVGISQ